MKDFPNAESARDSSLVFKDNGIEKALIEVQLELDKSISSMEYSVSVDVRSWNNRIVDAIIVFLRSKGYKDVSLFRGSQRDPCKQLNFKF